LIIKNDLLDEVKEKNDWNIVKFDFIDEINVEEISKDPENSYEYTKYLIENKKEVPEIIEKSISRKSYYAYDYVEILIKNNKEVSEIIQKSAKKSEKFKENPLDF
jgi:hypothetical protein